MKICKKCRQEIRERIEAYIEYRGGMGTRINAYDILHIIQYNKFEKKNYRRVWIKQKYSKARKCWIIGHWRQIRY